MSNILTHTDLQIKLQQAEMNLENIKALISFRFKELCERNPDIELNGLNILGLKLTSDYFKRNPEETIFLNTKDVLAGIKQIENHLTSKSNGEQTKLDL